MTQDPGDTEGRGRALDAISNGDRFQYVTAFVFFWFSLAVKFSFLQRIDVPGIHPLKASYQYLVAARNIHLNGEYAVESSKNVVLASEFATLRAEPSVLPNRFIAMFHSWAFDLVGFHEMLPLFVSLALSSLTVVILFFLVVRLFSFRVGVAFCVLYSVSGVVIYEGIWPGLYEFALPLFAAVCYLVLTPTADSDTAYNWPRILVLGVLMGMTVLTRNAFAFSLVPLVVYLYALEADLKPSVLRRNSSHSLREILDAGAATKSVAVFLIFSATVTGGILFAGSMGHDTGNRYLSDYAGVEGTDFDSFSGYGHLYPDPYTYHYRHAEYLTEVSDTTNPDKISFLRQYGYETSTDQFVQLRLNSARHYAAGFFVPNTTGPPSVLTLLLLAVGTAVLYSKQRDLAILFLGWPLFLYVVYVQLGTSNWDHFLEVLLPVLALQSVGIVAIGNRIASAARGWSGELEPSSLGLPILAILLVLVAFHGMAIASAQLEQPLQNADGRTMATLEGASMATNASVGPNETLAYGGRASRMYAINYYADVNVVAFTPETVQRLLDERRLTRAFDLYQVSAVVGYDAETTCRITSRTNARAVGSPEDCLGDNHLEPKDSRSGFGGGSPR